MQRPTCTNLRVRTARDAETLFHAVALGMLPMITRRLDSEERMALTTGCVYVWEERTSVVSAPKSTVTPTCSLTNVSPGYECCIALHT